MIVTYVLLLTLSNGFKSNSYYENKEDCLKSLTWHVEHNRNVVENAQCAQLKEPAERPDAKTN